MVLLTHLHRDRVLLAVWIALLLSVLPRPATAQGPVPVQVQAAVIKKVFGYDDELRRPLRLMIVHDGSSEEAADRIASAFAALEIEAQILHPEAAADSLEGVSSVYFLPGAATDELRVLCVEERILTTTGDVELTEEGRVALAVGLTDDGKPEIVIHLPRLEREGHELPARLLSLARVIR
ncbi:MAG: hypothetical protein R3234_07645 [Thermoanaerobaculia bacterium]|nr:hypothetical protein [Thermoanaerobaculia bacterium]